MAEFNGLGHEAEMIEGQKSQFDVVVDGGTAFSKQQAGRFPELGELLKLIPAP